MAPSSGANYGPRQASRSERPSFISGWMAPGHPLSPRLGWVDGFHTAYNLLSLEALVPISGEIVRPALQRGAQYYFEHLFSDGIPLYYADRARRPADINNVATGLRAAV